MVLLKLEDLFTLKNGESYGFMTQPNLVFVSHGPQMFSTSA